MALIKGDEFKFYIAEKLDVVNQENARDVVDAHICRTKTLKVNATRATITSTSRCGTSTGSGALSVTIDATFAYDPTDTYYNLVRTAFFTNPPEKVFVADMYPDLATGLGYAGNVSVLSFSESRDASNYAEVSISFGFDIDELLILDTVSA